MSKRKVCYSFEVLRVSGSDDFHSSASLRDVWLVGVARVGGQGMRAQTSFLYLPYKARYLSFKLAAFHELDY